MRDRGFSSFFLSSSPDRAALRIGILLDHELDRASASIIEDLVAADYLTLAVILFDADPAHLPSTGAPRSSSAGWLHRARRTTLALPARWARLAWDLYNGLDRRRVRLADDPVGLVDRDAALRGLDARPIRLVRDGGVRRLPAEGVERLRRARLDVVLQLGMADVRGDEGVAAYGVWAFRHGDGARFPGDPPHFWEMVDDSPTTAVTLEQRDAKREETRVLASAQFATDSGSLARNRVMPYYGSTFLIVRKLWELHGFGWKHVLEHSRPVAQAGSGPPRAGQPSNGAIVRWLVPRLLGSVRRRLARRVFARDEIEHWQMAIRVGGPGLEPDGPPDLSGFRWVSSPRGRFYADPFVVERAGTTWLFFEDYGYAERKGVISRAEVRPDGQLGAPRVVLTTDGHLSYPYVFFDGDDAWMVPESSAEGTARLYRASAFPDEWVEHAELLPEPALDTSIWKQDGHWWLFASLREPRGGATMLWLFHSDSLSGPWVPHPMNPISTDARTARGAGRIHEHRGRLLRPSQDGSRGYGSSFWLNEITTLSATDYEEHPVTAVQPDWAPRMLATHTYNRSGAIEVSDAKFRRTRGEVQ